MSSSDQYLTITKHAAAEPPKTKGSRFIGECFPVGNAGEALAMVDGVRKREHAATHHCWAYRLGPEGQAWRTNDDGEPSGSAGAPILQEIKGRGLSDCLVIVTRYYGGTKLGVGGLIRAYGEAAAAVLDAAGTKSVVLRALVLIRHAFPDTAPAMRLVEDFDAIVQTINHTPEGAEVRVLVPRSRVEAMQVAFVERLSGRGEFFRDQGSGFRCQGSD